MAKHWKIIYPSGLAAGIVWPTIKFDFTTYLPTYTMEANFSIFW